jgi:hypothetical protein
MKDYGPNRPPASPYQCFMGRWEGLCKTFTPEGEFLESGAVHMDVYWTADNVWHLHEDFVSFYPLGKPVTFHSDITVRGKTCFGESELVRLEGAELTPYNYVFTIWSAVSQTTVYNNHYFLDPNTRRILTHKVRDGKTNVFQIQDFVRIQQP